jgi:Protein of unknown function (DUF3606)
MPNLVQGYTSRDPKRIVVDDEADLRYWSTLLGCTASELRTVVAEVGPMSAVVAVVIRSRRRQAT